MTNWRLANVAVLIRRQPADEGSANLSRQHAPQIWREPVPMEQCLGGYVERCIGIPDDDIRVVSGRQRALSPFETHKASRRCAHPRGDSFDLNVAFARALPDSPQAELQ